MRVVKRVPIAS